MRLFLDCDLAANYTSPSQRIRVISEHWVGKEVFCPSCGSSLFRYENSRPAADFFCPSCEEDFELKAKKDKIGSSLVDGEYTTLIHRLESNSNPNLYLLNYDSSSLELLNFLIVPKQFFVPQLIKARKPLSKTARRAGWTGCNIQFEKIPQLGKIYYIQNKKLVPKSVVLKNWEKTLFLKQSNDLKQRGWTLDIIHCIESLNQTEFVLDDIYDCEDELSTKHPGNHNIKAKIRQQLQILRDGRFLTFLGRGKYHLL
jgi:type II restriction enzyme